MFAFSARADNKRAAREEPIHLRPFRNTAERTRRRDGGGGGVIPAHPGDIKVEITHTHAHTHTHTLCVEITRVCVCVRARARRLPPQSASSLLRRRKRPRTKWESSRSSSTIPGAPLSSSAALLHRLLLLPSPWLSPRDPPLRCPPVMSRSCEFTGGNSPSAARASSRLSPCLCVCVCVCCLSLSGSSVQTRDWFPTLDERPLRRLSPVRRSSWGSLTTRQKGCRLVGPLRYH